MNPHQGHGGDKGFNHKIWDVKIKEKNNVILKLIVNHLIWKKIIQEI